MTDQREQCLGCGWWLRVQGGRLGAVYRPTACPRCLGLEWRLSPISHANTRKRTARGPRCI